MKCMMSLLALFFVMNGYSQSSEPIIIYDPIVPKNFDYPAKPVIRSATLPHSQTSIFYNTAVTNNTYSIEGLTILKPNLKFNGETQEQDVIVVIDNKIYSISDKAFQLLDPSRILEMKIIKDDLSKTPVKNIIIIRTQ